MVIIEIQKKLYYGNNNLVKYKNENDCEWNYLYTDIETINLLISNFGINQIKTDPVCFSDNDKYISAIYCDVDIHMKCNGKLNNLNNL